MLSSYSCAICLTLFLGFGIDLIDLKVLGFGTGLNCFFIFMIISMSSLRLKLFKSDFFISIYIR